MARSRRLSLVLLFVAIAAGAQRLAQGVVPEHYDLTFTPDLAAATFAGEETIKVNIAAYANSITLNAAEIQFLQASVTQGDNQHTAQVSLDATKEQATLTLDAPLAPGPAAIQIRFTGILNDKLRGFYLSKSKSRRYATTQFESTDARRAFPNFDEPALKATFDIALVVDAGDTAISNGRIISDTPGPISGKHTIKFSTTPKMSSYLVAMAVGDFTCNEGSADGIPIRVCGTPDKKPLGEAALRYAGEILKYYNQYYGIKYPFGKLDVVGLPDFEAGAMENTAAIFYRESDLFIDDQNSSADSHAQVFVVLAHEMAHQWFGDLVTMKWWDNIWLNEGFANWMEKKPAEALHPEWHEDLEAVHDANEALGSDALRSTHAIHTRVETPEEINALFDYSISYEKSAAVLRMIESYISPDVFRRGVNAYLRKFQYGNASAEDFWTTMAQTSGRPVDKIMPTFVNQPGVPLVKVKAECVTPKAQPARTSGRRSRSRKTAQPHPKTEITLSQQRFVVDGKAESNQLWMIPVCIKTNDNKPFCQLLSEREQAVPVVGCASWVFTNANAVGYYRTQYDADDLKKLTESAVTGLNTAERMSFVGNERALVQAGQEPIGSLLDLVSSVNADPQRAVVESYANTLPFIDSYVVTATDREAYHSWLRLVFRPILAKLGWKTAAGESGETDGLRADVIEILGMAQDPETIQESTKLAREYLHDPNSADPNLAAVVLRVAARAGDMTLFHEYEEAMRRFTAPEPYYTVSQALADFAGPEPVEQVLTRAVSPNTRNQDAASLIASVLDSSANIDFAWQWIKAHWPEVEKTITMSSGEDIISATRGFCDAEHRDDVQSFFSEHKVPSSDLALKQAVDRIDSCIKYRKDNRDSLSAWLGQHASGPAVGRGGN